MQCPCYSNFALFLFVAYDVLAFLDIPHQSSCNCCYFLVDVEEQSWGNFLFLVLYIFIVFIVAFFCLLTILFYWIYVPIFYLCRLYTSWLGC